MDDAMAERRIPRISKLSEPEKIARRRRSDGTLRAGGDGTKSNSRRSGIDPRHARPDE
jgi:hypothetical protein